MSQQPVPARIVDDPRVQSLVEEWFPRLLDVLDRILAKYALDKTGSTDALDGFTRLVNARSAKGAPRA